MTSASARPAHSIMVLYTGGTIGMQAGAHGLTPASGFEQRMRAQLSGSGRLAPWRFREMTPLIDSANMTPQYWLRLRTAIIEAIDSGSDAVLVLHGTDTLAYSAAAMSFQLLGLDAPVLFTGSMLPAGVDDSDAWENLTGALQALTDGQAPGVQLYFHGELLAPSRTAKVRSFGRHPFVTLKRNSTATSSPAVPAALDYRQPKQVANVAVLPLVPGFSAHVLRAVINTGARGVILECFGSGTGPGDNPDFLAALGEAHASGVVVVAVSQCHEGGVELDIYEAGSKLRQAGVLSGGGMTREAAFGKLQLLLGAGLAVDEVRRLVEVDLAGELR
ncbi:asparaginase [Pseudomonas sp. 5P_5.1_Bac1]|uniref:asparaginase n=1 Tax=Pseudomonas sp. 5P_5.1_Bac1 TaxID=2971616 RepID=UPI0021C56D85|nr:asparaginase [Pseudomonas sp. 5P_5.1_Bac1]MCU1724591.1 asparaginase [Pseudomonas sp. 5P_5.1_Bac1]